MRVKQETLNLNLPCPISKSNLTVAASYENTDDSKGKFYISQDIVSDCTRKLKFKVSFPRAAINQTVLYSIRYANYKLQVKTINLKSGAVSDWIDVFTAVAPTECY